MLLAKYVPSCPLLLLVYLSFRTYHPNASFCVLFPHYLDVFSIPHTLLSLLLYSDIKILHGTFRRGGTA